MHLSFLSDSYISDCFADPDDMSGDEDQSFGRRHRDGVLRGLLFIAALALPLLLTVALNPSPAASDTAEAATHVRITHLEMR